MMYRFSEACATGTSWQGCVKLPPSFMIERFGDQRNEYDSPFSASWRFVSETGEMFTVYDPNWGASRASGWRTADELWTSCEPVQFQIGAMRESDWNSFRQWLLTEWQTYHSQVETGTAGSNVKQKFYGLTPRQLWEILPPEIRRQFLQSLPQEELLACLTPAQIAGLRKKVQPKRPAREGKLMPKSRTDFA